MGQIEGRTAAIGMVEDIVPAPLISSGKIVQREEMIAYQPCPWSLFYPRAPRMARLRHYQSMSESVIQGRCGILRSSLRIPFRFAIVPIVAGYSLVSSNKDSELHEPQRIQMKVRLMHGKKGIVESEVVYTEGISDRSVVF